MADPIGAASAVLTLVVFAFQSSKSLYNLISSFQSNLRTVRELKDELEALDEVLKSLQETATQTNVDLTALEVPLRRCSKACTDFEAIIIKCTTHSDETRTSYRDWAKLRYMGDDIVGFKNMLAGYKSTIIIAIGDANMRTSVVTLNFLKEFKEIIANTTSDLEQHLQEIDIKLQAVSIQDTLISDEDTSERQRIQEERDSAKQCLHICTKVSIHLNEVLPSVFENISTPSGASQGPVNTLSSLTSAQRVTAETLKTCKEVISDRTTWLQRHLQDIDNRLKTVRSQPYTTSNEQAAEKERILEEIDSIKQCLAICAQASRGADVDRINIFEDVAMSDDGHQVIVSTIGDLVSAKRITAGARSMQVMGQMSDDSLQQFAPHNSHALADKQKNPETGIIGSRTYFENRHGGGVKLS